MPRRSDRRAVTVAILTAQGDEALLHRGDPGLHRGVVDAVVHLMWIGLQVVEFPGVNVVAVEEGELVAVVAHSVMRARRVEARVFVIKIVDGLAPVRGCAPAEPGDERTALDRGGSAHDGQG